MKNKILAIMGLGFTATFGMTAAVNAVTLNCASYYQQNGERVVVQIDLISNGSHIESGKLKVLSSPATKGFGMIPQKGESAVLTRESLQNRILMSGKSSLTTRVGPGYSRPYYVNISEAEFKKSSQMTIDIQAGQASLIDGSAVLSAMQFTCQKI
jgi:hypothetical protein